MKTLFAILGVGMMFSFGVALAVSKPNLQAAAASLKDARAKMEAAQQANEFDRGGQAAKAKDLIIQAQSALDQALSGH